jgi:hypothetical protein
LHYVAHFVARLIPLLLFSLRGNSEKGDFAHKRRLRCVRVIGGHKGTLGTRDWLCFSDNLSGVLLIFNLESKFTRTAPSSTQSATRILTTVSSHFRVVENELSLLPYRQQPSLYTKRSFVALPVSQPGVSFLREASLQTTSSTKNFLIAEIVRTDYIDFCS